MAIKSILGVVLGLALLQASHAATTTYSWTGDIVGVIVDNGTGIYTGTQVGDNFSGTFTYDPDVNNITGQKTSDGDSIIELDDTWVDYLLGSSSGTVTDGTTQQNVTSAWLAIMNNHPDDEGYVENLLGKPVTLVDAWALYFSDGNIEVDIEYGSLLTDMYDDLSFRSTAPWSPPDAPSDPDNQIALFKIYEFDGFGNETFSAYGVITMSAVPIPAAVWLFGSGLVGLIVVARRKV